MSAEGGGGGAGGGGGGVLNVTPLFGVSSSSPHGYLLRCDDYTVLLDCGWTEAFDTSLFDQLTQSPPHPLHPRHPLHIAVLILAGLIFLLSLLSLSSSVLSEVDCVLLSHSSLRHVGALPYLRRWCHLRCPIYSTLPIHSMGAMTLYDSYQQSIQGVRRRTDDGSDDDLFTLDDIDAAFDSIHTLKYSEEWPLPPKLAGSGVGGASGGGGGGTGGSRLRISPHQSGHSVGGCVWRILRDSEVLLYSVDYHHVKERHLDSGVLEAFTRPSLLLMDCASMAFPSLWAPPAGLTSTRKAREGRVRDEAKACVRSGGICLLPCDSSGRVLELLLLFYQEWSVDAELRAVPLIFASPQSDATVDFAAQSIEWLSESCQRFLNKEQLNPFMMDRLHKVRDFRGVADLTRGFTRPAIILATTASLSPPSLAFQLLEAIAQLPQSTVLLTHDVSPDGSIAHQLLQQRIAALSIPSPPPSPFHVTFERAVQIPLEGEELRAFLALQKLREEQREMENKTTAMEEEEEEEEDEEEEDEEPLRDEGRGNGLHPLLSSAPTVTAMTSSFYVFPYQEPKRTVDAYGEVGLSGFIDAGKEALAVAAQSDNQMTDADERKSIKAEPAPPSRLPPSSASPSSAPPPPTAPTPTRVPSRIRFVPSSFSVLCRVVVEDFRGLSDGRSWRNILQAVKPRKLVLLHGEEADKAAIKRFALEKHITQQQQPQGQQGQAEVQGEGAKEGAGAGEGVAMDDGEGKEGSIGRGLTGTAGALQVPAPRSSRVPQSVFIPAVRECVDISAEVSFRLALASSLLPRLRFARIDEYEVAYTEAAVRMDPLQPMSTAQLVPITEDGQKRRGAGGKAGVSVSTHPSVFLGPSKLSDLRMALASAGIDCEFHGGAVLVAAQGSVRIRKASPSVITMQGVVSEQYFTIRRMLYQQFEKV